MFKEVYNRKFVSLFFCPNSNWDMKNGLKQPIYLRTSSHNFTNMGYDTKLSMIIRSNFFLKILDDTPFATAKWSPSYALYPHPPSVDGMPLLSLSHEICS
jgi:hypothetical protein